MRCLQIHGATRLLRDIYCVHEPVAVYRQPRLQRWQFGLRPYCVAVSCALGVGVILRRNSHLPHVEAKVLLEQLARRRRLL